MKLMKTEIARTEAFPSSLRDEDILRRVFQGLRPWLMSVVASRLFPNAVEIWAGVGKSDLESGTK